LTVCCRAGRTATTTEDFVNRYDQGPPYEGISNDEAIGRYEQIAPELAPEVYQQSAQDAFTRMAPEERAQFGQLLQQRAQQCGVDLPRAAPSPQRPAAGSRHAGPAADRPAPAAAGLLGQLLGGGALVACWAEEG
jgi:hypothetical protein